MSAEQQDSERLFAAPPRIHPRKVDGTFRRLKWGAAIVLLAIYFLAPWLRWDRGAGAPDQAILIDMAGRRAYFFWIEIWPQEVYYLTGVLILGAVGLFLATALYGRVWCGFTCPQTVWTDLFIWVERLVEGNRTQRMKLDKAPWGFDKIRKRLTKHLIWVGIGVITGWGFVLYFNDASTITWELLTGQASMTVLGFLGLFAFTTYLLAGWAREQVCIYMCPWPRFQGSMLDEYSRIVTYEDWRGEPRGKAKPGEKFEGRGHCVDCGMCVQVCPTGIDIRDGNQLACIGCALCVDACNNVMDRFKLPRGLITYDSTYNQAARAKGAPTVDKPIRGRTIAYLVVLALVGSLMVYGLTSRHSFEINILHDRQPLYVPLDEGVRNGYTFKILNMAEQPRSFDVTVEGLEKVKMKVIGPEKQTDPTDITLPVERDTVGAFRMYLTAPYDSIKSEATPITFRVTYPETGEEVTATDVFRAPAPNN